MDISTDLSMRDIDYAKLSAAVIDDEESTRDVISQLLRSLGLRRIHTASDGKEGLDTVIQAEPDIVFCDIHMEPVGGIQYLHQLRQFKKPEISQIPVVFLTADAEEATVLKSKNAKVNGYIVKPTSAVKLKDHINRLLGPVIP